MGCRNEDPLPELIRSPSVNFTEDQLRQAYKQFIASLFVENTMQLKACSDCVGELPPELLQDLDEISWEEENTPELNEIRPNSSVSSAVSPEDKSDQDSDSDPKEPKGNDSKGFQTPPVIRSEFEKVWLSSAAETIQGMSPSEKVQLRQKLRDLSDKMIDELLTTGSLDSVNSAASNRKAGGINCDQEFENIYLSYGIEKDDPVEEAKGLEETESGLSTINPRSFGGSSGKQPMADLAEDTKKTLPCRKCHKSTNSKKSNSCSRRHTIDSPSYHEIVATIDPESRTSTRSASMSDMKVTFRAKPLVNIPISTQTSSNDAQRLKATKGSARNAAITPKARVVPKMSTIESANLGSSSSSASQISSRELIKLPTPHYRVLEFSETVTSVKIPKDQEKPHRPRKDRQVRNVNRRATIHKKLREIGGSLRDRTTGQTFPTLSKSHPRSKMSLKDILQIKASTNSRKANNKEANE